MKAKVKKAVFLDAIKMECKDIEIALDCREMSKMIGCPYVERTQIEINKKPYILYVDSDGLLKNCDNWFTVKHPVLEYQWFAGNGILFGSHGMYERDININASVVAEYIKFANSNGHPMQVPHATVISW